MPTFPAWPSHKPLAQYGTAQSREIKGFDSRAKPREKKMWLNKSQTVAPTAERLARQPAAGSGFAADLAAAAEMNSSSYRDAERATASTTAVPISEAHRRKKGEPSEDDGRRSWSSKEKRKRDVEGMSSRGKFHNEEEKRLLRVVHNGAGQGFD
jgi:hypothetical protein